MQTAAWGWSLPGPNLSITNSVSEFHLFGGGAVPPQNKSIYFPCWVLSLGGSMWSNSKQRTLREVKTLVLLAGTGGKAWCLTAQNCSVWWDIPSATELPHKRFRFLNRQSLPSCLLWWWMFSLDHGSLRPAVRLLCPRSSFPYSFLLLCRCSGIGFMPMFRDRRWCGAKVNSKVQFAFWLVYP